MEAWTQERLLHHAVELTNDCPDGIVWGELVKALRQRGWRMSNYFINYELEDLLNDSGRVRVRKVMEKQNPHYCKARYVEGVE